MSEVTKKSDTSSSQMRLLGGTPHIILSARLTGGAGPTSACPCCRHFITNEEAIPVDGPAAAYEYFLVPLNLGKLMEVRNRNGRRVSKIRRPTILCELVLH